MNLQHEARHLGALAAGLCHDAGVRVELSPSTWAWDPLRRVILIAEHALRQKGAIYCAAVLAHEVSHYYISRYHLFDCDFPIPAALSHVLNAIEDPRVNTWIRRRYPGTGRWLQRLTEVDGRGPALTAVPEFIQFCLECAREELRSWEPAPVGSQPPAVADALNRTRDARYAYALTLPAGDLRPTGADGNIAERYRTEVWPELIGRARLDLPTPREQFVRVLVREALGIARRQILPIAGELLERDHHRLASWLGGEPRRQSECEQSLSNGDDAALRQIVSEAMQSAPDKPSPSDRNRDVARRALEAWLRALRGPGRACAAPLIAEARPGCPGEFLIRGRPGGRGRVLHAPAVPPGSRSPLRLPAPESIYDRAVESIANQVQQLVRDIEQILRPRKRLAESSGHVSGHRLDLRRVMSFDADPRTWDKLWRRKNIPDRINTAVSLLVDLSGSMRGPKTDAAVAGTVLLAETLHRLGVPFAINGFQDVLIPLCDFHDGLSQRVRDAIGEMPQEIEGGRSGGNNMPSFNDDGPCLSEAAEQLLNHPADDRMLIVVSDGMPEGRRSSESDLRGAIRAIHEEPKLKMIGIGLGPDTDHVRHFYPRSIAGVPVERFATEIATLLRELWD